MILDTRYIAAGAQNVAVVARRYSGHDAARRKVAIHTALRCHARPFADYNVVDQTGLPRENHVVLEHRAAGDPHTGHEQTAGADPHVVAHLDQVVDLRARADHCVPYAPTVHRSVRADFDVVFDDAASHVRNLAMLAVVAAHVPESIASQTHAGMQEHAAPDDSPGIADDAGKKLRVVTDDHAISDHTACPDPHIASESHVASQHNMGADFYRVVPAGADANDGSRVDTRNPGRLRIQGRDERQQRGMWIRYHNPGRRPGGLGELRLEEDDRCSSVLKVLEIARCRKKRQVAGLGPVDGREARNPHVGGADEPATSQGGDFARRQGPARLGAHPPATGCL